MRYRCVIVPQHVGVWQTRGDIDRHGTSKVNTLRYRSDIAPITQLGSHVSWHRSATYYRENNAENSSKRYFTRTTYNNCPDGRECLTIQLRQCFGSRFGVPRHVRSFNAPRQNGSRYNRRALASSDAIASSRNGYEAITGFLRKSFPCKTVDSMHIPT